MVVSRLLLGDFDDWQMFERERNAAQRITNRHAARSASAQIGRNYRGLSNETRRFIDENFVKCDYDDLARLCDSVKPGFGLHLRLDDFEKSFFGLAEAVKRRIPCYAHVSISTFGLQFEYPEHHFLGDMRAAFDDLKETLQRLDQLAPSGAAAKRQRDDIGPLVGREKFISRSMVSASFSLVESFMSGLFFAALDVKALGNLPCDEGLLNYAKSRESAALKDRLDRIVRFASSDKKDGRSEPFKSFIAIGKRYRDAIHHTTPFGRKDLEAGERLDDLYEIKADVALLCAILSLDSVLAISRWLYGEDDTGVITDRCKGLREEIVVYAVERGFATPS